MVYDKFPFIMRIMFITIICSGIFTIIGCNSTATTKQSYTFWSPTTASVANDIFTVNLSGGDTFKGVKSFNLTIENKTDHDLELVWDKTLYIMNGKTSGGFMFEGISYADRNNPKPPDIIFSKSSFSKRIFPGYLVYFHNESTPGIPMGWYNKRMPEGENGIYLTINSNGKEYHEKVNININLVSR